MAEFQIINGPIEPHWHRKPKRQKMSRYVLGVLSGITCILAGFRNGPSYNEALSLQVSRGEPAVVGLFIAMGLVLLCSMPIIKRPGTLWFCGLSLVGLGALVLTNPLSYGHLAVFVFLQLVVLAWLWSCHKDYPAGTLFWGAFFSSLGVLVCFLSLGIGERMCILGTLGSINALYYEKLAPAY